MSVRIRSNNLRGRKDVIGYAVLYGAKGVRSFRSLERAKQFAQMKKNQRPRTEVSIDALTPNSQFPIAIENDITPSMMSTTKVLKKKSRRTQKKGFLGFDFGIRI